MNDNTSSTTTPSTSADSIDKQPATVAESSPTPVVLEAQAVAESSRPNVASLPGLADALLRTPEKVAVELYRSKTGVLLLVTLILLAVETTGLVMASFSGGWQFLAVPLKLSAIIAFGPMLCLPSLYIFSCLSESRYDFGAVAIALCMGLGVMAILLCGLTPVAWVFAQSTNSTAFMGGLYVAMFSLSCAFGLGITGRLLTRGAKPIRILWLWQVLFVIVMLQLTTTLRPIVGPYAGVLPKEKMFFLVQWSRGLGG